MSAVRSLSGDKPASRGHGISEVTDPKRTQAAPQSLLSVNWSDGVACANPERYKRWRRIVRPTQARAIGLENIFGASCVFTR